MSKECEELIRLQLILEFHKCNSAGLFKDARQFERMARKLEKYLNVVASKPESTERTGFMKDGFDPFADTFGALRRLMRNELAGVSRAVCACDDESDYAGKMRG